MVYVPEVGLWLPYNVAIKIQTKKTLEPKHLDRKEFVRNLTMTKPLLQVAVFVLLYYTTRKDYL